MEKNSFESLINPVIGNVESTGETLAENDTQADAPLCFTETILISEVAQAIKDDLNQINH